jgi:hypothetical protein
MRANASFSIWGCLFPAPCNALLTKYTGFCIPSSSRTNAALTAVGETAKYRYSTSPGMVRLNRGGLIKYVFNWENAFSHSLVHSKAFLKILKNGRHLSVDREMKRFRAASLPVSCWSCFMDFKDCISNTAWIFSGLAYIPLLETM